MLWKAGVIAVLIMVITCYCDNSQPMYSGRMPFDGASACGRRFMGAEVIVDGRALQCLDIGKAITRNNVDVWHGDCEECLRRGRREEEVTVWARRPIAE